MPKAIDTEVDLSLRDSSDLRLQLAQSAITTSILNHIANYGDPRAADIAVKFKLKWMPSDILAPVEETVRGALAR